MKKSLMFAIGLQAAIMLFVLVPPLLNIYSGETVYLETRQVDPRALIRGDYVTLDYDIGLQVDYDTAKQAYDAGLPVYVVVTTDRPAKFVNAFMTKPDLKPGQACVVSRATDAVRWSPPTANEGFMDEEFDFRQSYVRFPQISQYFVPEGTGMDIQQELNQMVAKISVTSGCNAVVTGLELL